MENREVELDWSGIICLCNAVGEAKRESSSVRVIINELIKKIAEDTKKWTQEEKGKKETKLKLSLDNNQVISIFRSVLSVLNDPKDLEGTIVGDCIKTSENLGFYGEIKKKIKIDKEMTDSITFDDEKEMLNNNELETTEK